MRKIIASLDIGDAWIKLVIGEIVKNKLNILSCLETPSRGVKKGYIVNSESAIEALKEIFNKADETMGIKPSKVIVSVASNNLECFISEGYSSINNEDGVVSHNDVVRAMQSCVYNKVDESREIVTILPTKYMINDSEIVENPIGMNAFKLSVKVVVGTIPKKNAHMIIKCLEKINVEVVDITVGALGDYYLFRNKFTDSSVGAVVNIGSFKTEVSIFNKGILTSNEVILVGGDNIDYDLGYVYKINRRDSMYLKEKIALADKHLASPSEVVYLENKHGEAISVSQYDASEIVIARLTEILNLVKKQINLLTKKQISYIIITGGTTELSEFKKLVDELVPNAQIGEVKEIGARHNKYSTAVGLIRYYDSRLRLRNKDFSIYTIEEQEELSGIHKKVNIADDTILGKIFGYFFDN